jgi:hypothetical protein
MLKNKTLFKLYKYIVVLFKFLNKHFYIIPLLSLLSKLRKTSFFKSFNWFIKFIVILNIIIGVGIVLYLIDFSSPVNTTYSIYHDFIQFYIDLIKQFWNDIINFHNSVEDSYIKDSTNKIKYELKEGLKEGIREGMREGLKETIDEVLTEINEDNAAKANQLKTLAIIGSSLFFIYFLFALPNSTEYLSHYNWINQSLIEFKLGIKDYVVSYLSGPGNPGTPPAGSNPGGVVSPITPTISNLNTYFPVKVDAAVSPISPATSVISDTLSTVTPNTPMNGNSILPISPPILNKTLVDASTQTTIDALCVSRLVEMQNILADTLEKDVQEVLIKGCKNAIKTITD